MDKTEKEEKRAKKGKWDAMTSKEDSMSMVGRKHVAETLGIELNDEDLAGQEWMMCIANKISVPQCKAKMEENGLPNWGSRATMVSRMADMVTAVVLKEDTPEKVKKKRKIKQKRRRRRRKIPSKNLTAEFLFTLVAEPGR